MRFSFEHSGLSEDEYKESANFLASYAADLSEIASSGAYAKPESSVCLPGDGAVLNLVEDAYGEKVSKTLKYVIVIGIGGSNLGTKAVYNALWKNDGPQIIFLDIPDSKMVKLSAEYISQNAASPDNILINVISKSGHTIETIACAEYFINELKKKFTDVEKRTVVITDENSELWEIAKGRDIYVLPIPKSIGGRYSVFSTVGLFPLKAAGFNISAFREGALEIRSKCFSPEPGNNPAIMGASFLVSWYKKGKIIHDSFFFNPGLESLGKWYRQLLSESVGKSEFAGITPTVSIGSADLHSVGQLYLGGPKDKTTQFVESEGGEYEAEIPKDRIFQNLSKALDGKSFKNIGKAILGGVKISYEKRGLPFIEVSLGKITEKELGAYMQWKMIETMYVAKLLGVNAFDQPNVESYKNETDRILGNL